MPDCSPYHRRMADDQSKAIPDDAVALADDDPNRCPATRRDADTLLWAPGRALTCDRPAGHDAVVYGHHDRIGRWWPEGGIGVEKLQAGRNLDDLKLLFRNSRSPHRATGLALIAEVERLRTMLARLGPLGLELTEALFLALGGTFPPREQQLETIRKIMGEQWELAEEEPRRDPHEVREEFMHLWFTTEDALR